MLDQEAFLAAFLAGAFFAAAFLAGAFLAAGLVAGAFLAAFFATFLAGFTFATALTPSLRTAATNFSPRAARSA
ncbi:hypothetical protein EFK50_00255 [Nocardioides marmoriginsengisoli]|uniref:Uncharacterized protein n=1 Tax=Nocardioides marmoriginsengisoli TaxID=661483 RepID=A0A3N0CT53_9ACTN|nr:hypothetical protein EFK50_00255 [Nocardioides marmoriginsengisoli]